MLKLARNCSLLACAALAISACGRNAATPVPTQSRDANAASKAVSTSAAIAKLQFNPFFALTMGAAGTRAIGVTAYDANGRVIIGTYAVPVTISSTDTSGRTTLSGTQITTASGTVTLNYNGKGDTFTLTATAGSVTASEAVVTSLPAETPYVTPGAIPFLIDAAALGHAGAVWAPARLNYALGVVRIQPTGQMTRFRTPNSYYWIDNPNAIVRGSDGNYWLDFHDSWSEHQGIAKVTPAGAFTAYVFQGSYAYSSPSSFAVGPDGEVWFGLDDGMYEISTSGVVAKVASTPSQPCNLVLGRDNKMWFSTYSGYVGKVAENGTVSTYPVPNAPGNFSLQFTRGTDGLFWAPYPYGAGTLLKFNTFGQFVSNQPLPHRGTPRGVRPIGPMARDSSGNVYVADPAGQGVIRITKAGDYSEYPTNGSVLSFMPDASITVSVTPLQQIVVTDVRPNATLTGNGGAIVLFNASDW